MRTFHLLKTPDILCANDIRLSVSYYLGNNSKGATHFWKDRYRHVLVLYLERPRHNDAQSYDLGWGASYTTT